MARKTHDRAVKCAKFNVLCSQAHSLPHGLAWVFVQGRAYAVYG
jgi:hypothetical protein